MHDSALVGSGQRAGNLPGDLQGVLHTQRPIEPRSQCLAFVRRHDDELPSILGLADLMDGTDVRLVQRGSRSRFLQEPALVEGIATDLGGDELECDGAVEPDVPGPIDHSHAAAADPLEDLVVRDASADPRIGPICGRCIMQNRPHAGAEQLLPQPIDILLRSVRCRQQRGKLGAERRVVARLALDELVAPGRRKRVGLFQEQFEPVPA